MIQRLELPYRQQLGSNLVYYYSGSERCEPGHSYGPAVRHYYLIHYVRSGHGIFRVSGTEYTVRAGQIFLINPGEVTYYQADLADPWHYSWVAFDGLEAASNLRQANLTTESPVKTLSHVNIMSCFDMLEDAKKLSVGRELRLTGGVYLFFSSLLEATVGEHALPQPKPKPRGLYVKAAIEFMEKNFSRHMTIEELASYIGLNRSYLRAIFKEETQQSPQQYLIRYRMERACELLENVSLSVGDISRSVGYDDPLVFSKMFTKMKGVSPRDYRKQAVRLNLNPMLYRTH